MAGLSVVQALAVEKDEGFSETRAAYGKIGLDSIGSALFEVERGIELQQVNQGIEDQGIAADRKHADGTVDLFELHGLEGTGDDNRGVRGLLLGRSKENGKKGQEKDKNAQLRFYDRRTLLRPGG